MRLFTAIVPPAHVCEHLDRALDLVRGELDPDGSRRTLRWAPPEDRHLTLAFYGDVSAGRAEELSHGLEQITASRVPFEVRLRGAGVFDRRILWVGCGGDVEAFAALSAECVDLGLDVTGRDDHRVRSRAHLTVARVTGRGRAESRGRANPWTSSGSRGRADVRGDVDWRGRPDSRQGRPREPDVADVAAVAHALAVYEGPAWEVTDIALFDSRPGEGRGGGPAYDRIATLGLGAPGGTPGDARL